MSYLKKLNGRIPKEIENNCHIPTALIPLAKDDLDLLACGMDDYLYKEIEDSNNSRVIEKLVGVLNYIKSIPKNSQTIESLGYVLRCNSGLSWAEFNEIRMRFLELCKYGNVHFNYGVVEDKTRLSSFSLSVFYFIGEMKRQPSDITFDVGEAFMSQVKLINDVQH